MATERCDVRSGDAGCVLRVQGLHAFQIHFSHGRLALYIRFSQSPLTLNVISLMADSLLKFFLYSLTVPFTFLCPMAHPFFLRVLSHQLILSLAWLGLALLGLGLA